MLVTPLVNVEDPVQLLNATDLHWSGGPKQVEGLHSLGVIESNRDLNRERCWATPRVRDVHIGATMLDQGFDRGRVTILRS